MIFPPHARYGRKTGKLFNIILFQCKTLKRFRSHLTILMHDSTSNDILEWWNMWTRSGYPNHPLSFRSDSHHMFTSLVYVGQFGRQKMRLVLKGRILHPFLALGKLWHIENCTDFNFYLDTWTAFALPCTNASLRRIWIQQERK